MESTKTGGNIIKLLYTKDEREHGKPKRRRKRRTLTMKMTKTMVKRLTMRWRKRR